jgi:DNA-binding GntR family transcriptional regulator
MTHIHLGTFKYVLAAPHEGEQDISVLEAARDRYKARFEEAQGLASKDPMSPIALKNVAYYSRAYKAFDLLIAQLQDKPHLLSQVLNIVGHVKSLRKMIASLEKLGFDINTHIWGEGMYKSPSYREKTVPISEPTPPKL